MKRTGIALLSAAALLAAGGVSAASSDIKWTYLEGGYITADGNDNFQTDGYGVAGSIGFLGNWHAGASYAATSSSGDFFTQDLDTDSWTVSVGFHGGLTQTSQAYFDVGYFNAALDDKSNILQNGEGDTDGFQLTSGFRFQPNPKVELGAAIIYTNGSVDGGEGSNVNYNDTSVALNGQYFIIPAWSVGAKLGLNGGSGSASFSSSSDDVLTIFTRYSFGDLL